MLFLPLEIMATFLKVAKIALKLRCVLLRDRGKEEFKRFYPTLNRNLNFPAAAAETFKGGHPRKAKPTSLPKET